MTESQKHPRNYTIPNVSIVTRWHQVAVFSVLLLPLGILAFSFLFVEDLGIKTSTTFITAIAVLFVASIVVPIVLITVYFPPIKDVMHVESDALVGAKYGRIPFDDIVQYNLDDYIKISRQGQPTLLLQNDGKVVGYQELYTKFEIAISNWKAPRPESGIRQAYFYGSWKARLMGGFLLFGSIIVLIVVCALNLYGAYLMTLGLTLPMGLRLLVSKRKKKFATSLRSRALFEDSHDGR